MQSSVESLGALQRRLNVSVPVAQIDSEVESRLKNLSRTVKLHGFRPGKVPMKVVVQQFGGQVRQEVLGDAVQKSFGEAVKAQNLRVAGYPQFESKPGPVGEALTEFEYSATFEVYPDVIVGDLAVSAVTRPSLVVSEADVDKTIEVLRKQRTVYEPAARAAQTDDQVSIDFTGTIDGIAFPGGEGKNQVVVIGAGRLLPEFEQALAGMAAGTSKEFDVRFPDDYHGKEVAGKTARFAATVLQVAAPRVPEVGPEFAKALGVADGDVTKMRAEIRANVEREVRARIKARVKDQVMQALLDVSTLEVPKALVEIEVQRLEQSARADLEGRGIKVKDLPFPADMFREQGERRVRLGLILAEVVAKHGLSAKPERVRAVVDEFAQSYEQPQEVVKWYYQSRERMSEVESLVLEENVVEWVLGCANVADQAIAFEDLMGNR